MFSWCEWGISLETYTGSIGVKMKSWIAEPDLLFRDARVPRQLPSTRVQTVSRGKPKRQCCWSAIETRGLP